MKKIIKWAGMLSLILVLDSGSFAPKVNAQPGISVSVNLFYDELRPHGTWRHDAVYGQVWQPRAEKNFRPYYTRGHWVMTDAGNCWTSDYDWGWAPFHYGRWVQRRNIGWVWVPGTEWAPAWVSWRSGGDDYGWAPLTPEVNITLEIGGGRRNPRYNDNYYYNGYDNGSYGYEEDAYIEDIPVAYWVFVPRREILRPDFYRYDRGPRYNTTIVNNTTIINNINVYNNTRYVYGPRANEIQRYTGRPVPVYRLQNENRPGRTVIRNNVVNIYKPVIRNTTNNRFVNNRFLDRRSNLAERNERIRLANQNRARRIDNTPNPNNKQWSGNRREQLQQERAALRQQQQANQQKATIQKKEQLQNQRVQSAQQKRLDAQTEHRENVQQKRLDAQTQRQQAAQQKKQQADIQRTQAAQQKKQESQVQRQQAAQQQKQQAEAQRNQAVQQRKQEAQAQRQQAAQQQRQQAETQRNQAVQQRKQEAQAQRQQAQAQKEAQRNASVQQARQQQQAQKVQAAQQAQAQRQQAAQQQRQQAQAQRQQEAQQRREAVEAKQREHQENRKK